VPHPDYPGLVAFPLQDVMNALGGVGYFNSTAAYAVAFAVAIGVEKITLFGFDFTYPNAHQAEQGRACVEFYLGMAKARGIEIGLPNSTTLMDGCTSAASALRLRRHGDRAAYDDAGQVTLTFTPRPARRPPRSRPRYDHSNTPTPWWPQAAASEEPDPHAAKVLKAFPYAHDHHHVVTTRRGRRRRDRRGRLRGPGGRGLHPRATDDEIEAAQPPPTR
jgi:hypothetical protein